MQHLMRCQWSVAGGHVVSAYHSQFTFQCVILWCNSEHLVMVWVVTPDLCTSAKQRKECRCNCGWVKLSETFVIAYTPMLSLPLPVFSQKNATLTLRAEWPNIDRGLILSVALLVVITTYSVFMQNKFLLLGCVCVCVCEVVGMLRSWEELSDVQSTCHFQGSRAHITNYGTKEILTQLLHHYDVIVFIKCSFLYLLTSFMAGKRIFGVSSTCLPVSEATREVGRLTNERGHPLLVYTQLHTMGEWRHFPSPGHVMFLWSLSVWPLMRAAPFERFQSFSSQPQST